MDSSYRVVRSLGIPCRTATPFFSEFFNTDCLVVEGEPYFSVTGATKTLYGHTGGSSLESLRTHLAKTAGPKKSVTAGDLSYLAGILPVQTTSGKGRAQEALAMTQDTFKSLLKLYRGKNTKAGRYADEITDKLIGVSLKRLEAQLAKTSGPQTAVTAAELSDLSGISPVLIDNGHMQQEGHGVRCSATGESRIGLRPCRHSRCRGSGQ
jgi:hypothetical protein